MKIAIHGKSLKSDHLPHVQRLFELLDQRNFEYCISEYFEQQCKKLKLKVNPKSLFKLGDTLDQVDFFFSLGGDGTLLESVTYVREQDIPIMGINTGRLGFLSTVPKEGIEMALEALFSKQYQFDERSLIHVESDRNLFEGLNFGLNEFTIVKKDTSSMIVVHTYIDGEYLNSYWADGLIISTPTGSTGYSLSCGGPVVVPQSNNFIITPVSPHNLNVRPMIVSDSSVISFEIEGRSRNFLISLDSRSRTVDSSVQIAVRKEDFTVKLVKFEGYNFLDTLRQKLNWGLDLRN